MSNEERRTLDRQLGYEEALADVRLFVFTGEVLTLKPEEIRRIEKRLEKLKTGYKQQLLTNEADGNPAIA